MRERVKSLKRILEVQKHLHALEELKFVRLQQKVKQCEDEQEALTRALSTEDALQGMFIDVTVRRIKSLQLEASKIAPELEAQARVVLDHGGRLRNTERLAQEIGVEQRRVEEREELEQVLEARFAQESASSKQDQ